MRVFVGLGNPGPKYEQTRHNVGFVVVRSVATSAGIDLCSRGPVLEGRGVIDGMDVRLVLPQTYMNQSGAALATMLDPPRADELVVVFDDVDLPVGVVRVRRSGGSGGHRGVSSLVEIFGTEFIRLRIGVGRAPGTMDTAAHVLAPMSEAEFSNQLTGVVRGAEAAKCIVTGGVDAAMRNYNGHPPAMPS